MTSLAVANRSTTTTTSTVPPPTVSIVSAASPHSQAFRWALRFRRKGESITLQKIWKINKALRSATQTPMEDSRADISLGLARAACVSSYEDLVRAASTTTTTTTRPQQILQQRVQALYPEIQQLYPVDPFLVAYLQFIERSVPVIEQTRLGKPALSHVLDHVELNESGLWVEFGVSKGTTLSRIAQRAAQLRTMDATGTNTKQVYGFDSFRGLPTAWRVGFDVGKFNLNGIPPVLHETNALFEIGWFEETLPLFLTHHPDVPFGLIHIDCDVYESARCVLSLLMEAKRIVVGTVIVFDELLNYNGFERHEMRALFEMLQALKMENTGEETKEGNGLGIEWIGSKHAGCMSVAVKMVAL